jgi:hypothetical protein
MLAEDIITPAVSQARQRILNVQKMIASVEGRTLDFEAADAIQRTLIASLKDLAPLTEKGE